MPINVSKGPESMTNHEKTVVGTNLVGEYNFLENVLANLGLDVVVVAMRAKAAGYAVDNVILKGTDEEREAYKNISINGSGIDWK